MVTRFSRKNSENNPGKNCLREHVPTARLGKKILQQNVMPDWFVPDSTTDYSSEFAGTYMASWTFIASPLFMKN